MYRTILAAGAAAIALVPIVIMLGYLAAVRRTGALDNL